MLKPPIQTNFVRALSLRAPYFNGLLAKCCENDSHSVSRLVTAGTALVLAVLFSGCVGIPKGVQPVGDFSLDRYLGQWHEIARMDHSFERGLSSVTANYSLRDNGGVRVLNRGYSEKSKKWKEAEGKAFFVGRPDQGYLKVSFFGPFYGSYVVFDLDEENYQHALVCGPNKSYLWILARTPEIPTELRDALVARAATQGFDTNKLIFPDKLRFTN